MIEHCRSCRLMGLDDCPVCGDTGKDAQGDACGACGGQGSVRVWACTDPACTHFRPEPAPLVHEGWEQATA